MRWLVALYAIAVVLVAGSMWGRRAGAPTTKETGMNWSELKKNVHVPAKPAGIWTLAHDFVEGPARLKIEATGKWRYSTNEECGPDGDLRPQATADHAMLPTAPLGALLVKIGGSTAGTKDGVVSVVGSTAVLDVGEKGGPIFLTINDELTGFVDNSGEVVADLTWFRPPKPGPRASAASPAAPGSTPDKGTSPEPDKGTSPQQ